MARIRTIKPEFWSDEKLAPLSPIHRLVFLGLVSQADDAGRILDNVRLLDGLLFPYTEESCTESLTVLSELGRIRRYVSDSGQRLIQIEGWEKHQKVKNPSVYTLPAPCTENRGRTAVDSTETLTPRSPIPYPLSTIPEDDPPREASPPAAVLGEARELLGNSGADALGALSPPGGISASLSAIRSSLLYESESDGSPEECVLGLPIGERRQLVARALIEMQAAGSRWSSAALAGFVRRIRTKPSSRTTYGNETQRDLDRATEARRRHSESEANRRQREAKDAEQTVQDAWDWLEMLDAATRADVEREVRDKVREMGKLGMAMQKTLTLSVINERRKQGAA